MYTLSKVWSLHALCNFEFADEETCSDVLSEYVNRWCEASPFRSAACSYNISIYGKPHFHLILMDDKVSRSDYVMGLYPEFRVNPFRGVSSKFGMDIFSYLLLISGDEEILSSLVRRKLEGCDSIVIGE